MLEMLLAGDMKKNEEGLILLVTMVNNCIIWQAIKIALDLIRGMSIIAIYGRLLRMMEISLEAY